MIATTTRDDQSPQPRSVAGLAALAHPQPAALKRRTAQEVAYETLRRAILRGSLAAGTRLVQSDIASHLELSTTPVREALRDLAAEGLVRIDTHRGAIVRGLNVDELKEVYELRLLLEPVAIRKAVKHISENELQHAYALCTRMDSVRDPATWSELNREFHGVFAEAARSPYLSRILAILRDSAAGYVRLSIQMRPEVIETTNRQHYELVETCRRRDGDAAADLEREHLLGTMNTVLSERMS